MTLGGPGTLGGALISVVKKKKKNHISVGSKQKCLNSIACFLNTNPANEQLLTFLEKKSEYKYNFFSQ